MNRQGSGSIFTANNASTASGADEKGTTFSERAADLGRTKGLFWGFASKQSKQLSVKWRQRFLVLLPEKQLYYFENENDTKSLSHIDLGTMKRFIRSNKKQIAMEIVDANDRVYRFAWDSEGDLAGWWNWITLVSRSSKEQLHQMVAERIARENAQPEMSDDEDEAPAPIAAAVTQPAQTVQTTPKPVVSQTVDNSASSPISIPADRSSSVGPSSSFADQIGKQRERLRSESTVRIMGRLNRLKEENEELQHSDANNVHKRFAVSASRSPASSFSGSPGGSSPSSSPQLSSSPPPRLYDPRVAQLSSTNAIFEDKLQNELTPWKLWAQEQMSAGAVVMKFPFLGQGSRPKRRFIQLTPDYNQLRWGTKRAPSDFDGVLNRCVLAEDIVSVEYGAQSETFKYFLEKGELKPIEAALCLSLTVNVRKTGQQRTIDLRFFEEQQLMGFLIGLESIAQDNQIRTGRVSRGQSLLRLNTTLNTFKANRKQVRSSVQLSKGLSPSSPGGSNKHKF